MSAVRRRGPRAALSPEQCRYVCPAVAASRRPPSTAALLGQPRAIAALRVGLELYAEGYNVFVSGLLGTGRLRIVESLLEELKPACRLGPDRVYVRNVREPNRPRLITLRRGSALAFRAAMRELLEDTSSALRTALHARRHRASRKLVIKGAEDRTRRLLATLERQAEREGLALVQHQVDGALAPELLPFVDGQPCALEDLEAAVRAGRFTRARRDRVLRAREEWMDRLEEVTERSRRVYRTTQRELREMDWQVAERIVAARFDAFAREWPSAGVADYLADLTHEIRHDLPAWGGEVEGEEPPAADRDAWAHYDVHVVQAHDGEACPVVVEPNPTYENLFGTIEPAGEHDGEVGRIHVGSLVRADGGYLVLRAADVIAEPGVWKQLKRALRDARAEIRAYDPMAGTTSGALQPDAIDLDLKVVLIGEPGTFEHLAEEDPQFEALFKVHAEFDTTLVNNAANRRRYADFLDWLARREQLAPFGGGAAAAIVEFGARRAGRQDRLTTCFGELADVARESHHVARLAGARRVGREHVAEAIAVRDHRHGLLRERLEREQAEGYVTIATSGHAVGVINALSVLQTGALVFGRVVRVTAAVGVAGDGKGELVSIEREAELSGPLHDKGVLILQGLLLERFGRRRPLALRATLCFEQLYSGLDGDSASAAEFLALVSSLGRVPIAQSFAVTGAIDQRGAVQAVGAVTEKVEAFWRAARAARRARAAVLIPHANRRDLMLAPEVVADVRAGRFAVHAIRDVDEGIALLTGRPARDVYAAAEAELDAAEAARCAVVGPGRLL